MTEAEMREHCAARLKDIRAADLSAAIVELMALEHDYGTVCVAIGEIGAAAASAANREPNGGITGFQASAAFWEFVRAWRVFDEGPKRMVQFANMLNPQYSEYFAQTITPDTWQWLQERASEELASDHGSKAVRAHWQSIVDGRIPFGYAVVSQ